MTFRISVSDAVRSAIDDEPIFQEVISRGLVNYTALAREITPKVEALVGKKVPPNTIVRSIIRYSKTIEKKPRSKEFLRGLANSSVLITGSIVCINLYATIDLLPLLSEALQNVFLSSRRFPRVFHIHFSRKTVKLIVEEEVSQRILEAVGEEQIASIKRGLSEVVLNFSSITEETVSHNFVIKLLYRLGIEIDQLLRLNNKLIFVVNDYEAHEAHRVLSEEISLAKRILVES
ncbi:MAG: hypothetical protein ACE5GD_02485 [Candidatus Geothermarchaeales archaeon]